MLLLDGSTSPQGNAAPAQGTVSWPLLSRLGSRTAGQEVPSDHHCSLAALRWALRSSLPISSPRKQHKGEGNPKPHAYGIQGFPVPQLYPSCPLAFSLKWATSSSLLTRSPKNVVRDEGNPKSHVHGIQKCLQHPPAAPTLCPMSAEGCREDRFSLGWKLGWLGAAEFVQLLEQGKMKRLGILVVKDWEGG